MSDACEGDSSVATCDTCVGTSMIEKSDIGVGNSTVTLHDIGSETMTVTKSDVGIGNSFTSSRDIGVGTVTVEKVDAGVGESSLSISHLGVETKPAETGIRIENVDIGSYEELNTIYKAIESLNTAVTDKSSDIVVDILGNFVFVNRPVSPVTSPNSIDEVSMNQADESPGVLPHENELSSSNISGTNPCGSSSSDARVIASEPHRSVSLSSRSFATANSSFSDMDTFVSSLPSFSDLAFRTFSASMSDISCQKPEVTERRTGSLVDLSHKSCETSPAKPTSSKNNEETSGVKNVGRNELEAYEKTLECNASVLKYLGHSDECVGEIHVDESQEYPRIMATKDTPQTDLLVCYENSSSDSRIGSDFTNTKRIEAQVIRRVDICDSEVRLTNSETNERVNSVCNVLKMAEIMEHLKSNDVLKEINGTITETSIEALNAREREAQNNTLPKINASTKYDKVKNIVRTLSNTELTERDNEKTAEDCPTNVSKRKCLQRPKLYISTFSDAGENQALLMKNECRTTNNHSVINNQSAINHQSAGANNQSNSISNDQDIFQNVNYNAKNDSKINSRSKCDTEKLNNIEEFSVLNTTSHHERLVHNFDARSQSGFSSGSENEQKKDKSPKVSPSKFQPRVQKLHTLPQLRRFDLNGDAV
jgi:hypothetical protein